MNLGVPLFQFLGARARTEAARREPQCLPLWAHPPVYVSEPVQMLVLLVRGMAKKPKLWPQLHQVYLPQPVRAGSSEALTLTFRLMSGAVLGTCTVGVPSWDYNFEVLSKLLGQDLKLLHIKITPALKAHLSKEPRIEVGQRDFVHGGALVFEVPGSLELTCVNKFMLNLRTALTVETAMPTGWRRWYHEFRSLCSWPATDCFGKAQVRELARWSSPTPDPLGHTGQIQYVAPFFKISDLSGPGTPQFLKPPPFWGFGPRKLQKRGGLRNWWREDFSNHPRFKTFSPRNSEKGMVWETGSSLVPAGMP